MRAESSGSGPLVSPELDLHLERISTQECEPVIPDAARDLALEAIRWTLDWGPAVG